MNDYKFVNDPYSYLSSRELRFKLTALVEMIARKHKIPAWETRGAYERLNSVFGRMKIKFEKVVAESSLTVEFSGVNTESEVSDSLKLSKFKIDKVYLENDNYMQFIRLGYNKDKPSGDLLQDVIDHSWWGVLDKAAKKKIYVYNPPSEEENLTSLNLEELLLNDLNNKSLLKEINERIMKKQQEDLKKAEVNWALTRGVEISYDFIKYIPKYRNVTRTQVEDFIFKMLEIGQFKVEDINFQDGTFNYKFFHQFNLYMKDRMASGESL